MAHRTGTSMVPSFVSACSSSSVTGPSGGSLGGNVSSGRLSQLGSSSAVVDAPQAANIVVVLRATPPNHVLA
jgi:hypothetical protein